MDWSLGQIVYELVTRITSGPMRFRFVMQPMMAVILGIRDGKHDALSGAPPFLMSLVTESAARKARLKGIAWRLRGPVIIASSLDAIVQYVMFQLVRPLTAVLVGSMLMAVPYSAARGLSNRWFTRHPEWLKRRAPHSKPARGGA